MIKINNLTNLEKIYFSVDAINNCYHINGLLNGNFGRLVFGKTEKYNFIAFINIKKTYKNGLGWKPIWTYNVYNFKIVDKHLGNEVYKVATNIEEQESKNGKKYRNLNILKDYFN